MQDIGRPRRGRRRGGSLARLAPLVRGRVGPRRGGGGGCRWGLAEGMEERECERVELGRPFFARDRVYVGLSHGLRQLRKQLHGRRSHFNDRDGNRFGGGEELSQRPILAACLDIKHVRSLEAVQSSESQKFSQRRGSAYVSMTRNMARASSGLTSGASSPSSSAASFAKISACAAASLSAACLVPSLVPEVCLLICSPDISLPSLWGVWPVLAGRAGVDGPLPLTAGLGTVPGVGLEANVDDGVGGAVRGADRGVAAGEG